MKQYLVDGQGRILAEVLEGERPEKTEEQKEAVKRAYRLTREALDLMYRLEDLPYRGRVPRVHMLAVRRFNRRRKLLMR
jgi:hypothetical protein